MEIYDHPTFRMACEQFDQVADHKFAQERECLTRSHETRKHPLRQGGVSSLRRDGGHCFVSAPITRK